MPGVMFNFSDFCKQKGCPHYKEVEHQVGMWKYCELVGVSFYVVQRPDNCPHKDELDALAEYEKEKALAWHKLNKKAPSRVTHNKDYEAWAKAVGRKLK